jgi:hypothetical protein
MSRRVRGCARITRQNILPAHGLNQANEAKYVMSVRSLLGGDGSTGSRTHQWDPVTQAIVTFLIHPLAFLVMVIPVHSDFNVMLATHYQDNE